MTDAATGAEQSHEDFRVAEGERLVDVLKEILERPSLTEPQYTEVQILMDTPSTRVPIEEFRRDEADSIFRLTYGMDNLEGREVRYEILPSLEVAELFSVDPEVEELLLHHYPQAKAHGYYGYILEQTVPQDRQREGDEACLYVSLRGNEMFIFSFTPDGRLRFANTYTAKSTPNQLYYLLYVWKVLKMDQRRDACVLLDGTDELRAELKKYILHIE